ncbi:MAG: DTW domain-containing protein, partial [Planctomycetota bacterium]|nr:DTW domain-containing protein [Planctomycetota bacterium]
MPPRDRCYDCFRPTEHCLCRWIEPVDNRTGILVLQHPKERGHAFNTVRLARLALKRSEVIAGYVPDLAR